MAKIEIEIDDALLARAAATGHTAEELAAEGFTIAVTSCEQDQRIGEWMRKEEEREHREAAARAAWLEATHPALVKSRDALRVQWGDKADRQRTTELALTEEQAATFAWLSLVTDAWAGTRPFVELVIDLDDPVHWQAAQNYARRALYQHFKKERFALEWGTHPFLFRKQEGDAEPPDQ